MPFLFVFTWNIIVLKVFLDSCICTSYATLIYYGLPKAIKIWQFSALFEVGIQVVNWDSVIPFQDIPTDFDGFVI